MDLKTSDFTEYERRPLQLALDAKLKHRLTDSDGKTLKPFLQNDEGTVVFMFTEMPVDNGTYVANIYTVVGRADGEFISDTHPLQPNQVALILRVSIHHDGSAQFFPGSGEGVYVQMDEYVELIQHIKERAFSEINNYLDQIAKPATDKVYCSDRGNALICQEPRDKPVVTVENYRKWYSLQLLHPDGSVTPVDVDVLDEATDECWRIDHCYHPKLLRAVAKKNGWYCNSESVEIVAGRWAMEIEDLYR